MPRKQSIAGYNDMSFRCLTDFDSLQVDLFNNFKIDSIISDNKLLNYRRIGNAIFIQLDGKAGAFKSIRVYYDGKPQRAVTPPWDGGFVWEKDIQGSDWIGVACQGTGASCWWPCKDHQSDEPDSMRITITHPIGLTCVCNGQKEKETTVQSKKHVTWRVTYPVNNYNVTINIADYVYFTDTVITGGIKLPLEYYVLSYNLEKAKQHFKQVPLILGCYENYFGPYPFVRDGYKLVETHYWGMEHQSCISYGNAYLNTALGFDFIILHETAHEWWGNQLTAADNADMWLHEGFGTYAEALYVECTKEPEEVNRYMKNMRWRIQNKFPVVGPYGVNYQGIKSDNDMYFKGAWVIHTFRALIQDDKRFLIWLKSLQTHFAFKECSTALFIQYTNQFFGEDYTAFFNQYLMNKDIPELEYGISKNKLTARWKCENKDFKMPVYFIINNEAHRLPVSTTVQVIYDGKCKKKNVVVDDSVMLFEISLLKKL